MKLIQFLIIVASIWGLAGELIFRGIHPKNKIKRFFVEFLWGPGHWLIEYVIPAAAWVWEKFKKFMEK